MKDFVFLGLGSNLDNRLWYIVQALRHLDNSPNIQIEKMSSVYETEPYGIKEQRNFLNAVVQIQTHFRPAKLLQCVKFIERKLGRIHRSKWHSREIDIDILAYGQEKTNLSWLTIPHSDLQNRRFVLVPFDEIAPQFELVEPRLKICSLVQTCPDRGEVRLIIPAEELHIQFDPSVEKVLA